MVDQIVHRAAGPAKWVLPPLLLAFLALLASGGVGRPYVARAAGCTISWTGAGGGGSPGGFGGPPGDGTSWQNPANWAPSRVPDSTDDVCITAPGTGTISLLGNGFA